MITNRVLMIVVAITAAATGTAKAQVKSPQTGASIYSSNELAIVCRNKALSRAVKLDPLVVRRLLDSIYTSDQVNGATSRTIEPKATSVSPAERFDPNTNPDADRLERASPKLCTVCSS